MAWSRARFVLGAVLLVAACARAGSGVAAPSAAAKPSPRPAPAAPQPAPAAPRPAPAAPAAPAAASPAKPVPRPSADQVNFDLRATAPGFAGLASRVGPHEAEAIGRRLQAYPELYLDAIEATYLGGALPYEAHAVLDLPALLGELHPRAARRVHFVALRLESLYGSAAVEGPAAAQGAMRARLRELETLVGGIDTARDATSSPVVPGEICVRAFPGAVRRLGLTVRRECVCSETLSCEAVASGGTIRVAVFARPGICLDCTTALTSCTVVGLSPSTSYDVVPAGQGTMGKLATDAAGSLGEGECLRRPAP